MVELNAEERVNLEWFIRRLTGDAPDDAPATVTRPRGRLRIIVGGRLRDKA